MNIDLSEETIWLLVIAFFAGVALGALAILIGKHAKGLSSGPRRRVASA